MIHFNALGPTTDGEEGWVPFLSRRWAFVGVCSEANWEIYFQMERLELLWPFCDSRECGGHSLPFCVSSIWAVQGGLCMSLGAGRRKGLENLLTFQNH